MTLTSGFDLVADRFERYRALPNHVPAAIRQALHVHGGIDASARLLEVGCGTGRIGAQFAAERDNYFGVDLSMAMLREFHRKKFAPTPALVHADAGRLPFGNRVFDAVFMMHMTGARNWRVLLAEAQRVLQSGGVLAIGGTRGPPDGLDATMQKRLDELIAEMGAAVRSPDRGAIGKWLRATSSRHMEITPAHCNPNSLPSEFTTHPVHLEMINGNCYAMTGMHVMSKLIDKWIWATFEPQNSITNPNRCKDLGCLDPFGSRPAKSNGRDTRLSQKLEHLIDAANLAPEWKNYRLDGVQTDYFSPKFLSNSIIEGENGGIPANQASCITCHALSSVKSDGTDGITLLNPNARPVGFPLPLPSMDWIRRDFVWSLLLACPGANSKFNACAP